MNSGRLMRILSAIVLLAVAVIHLYLVFYGVGGVLGVLFVLDGIGGLVLAVAVLTLRGLLLRLAVAASLLYLVGGLAGLLLALTVGLFGITEVWSFTLVPETVVVEVVGIVVLAITAGVVWRERSSVHSTAAH